RRHTRLSRDLSSDVCSSDLEEQAEAKFAAWLEEKAGKVDAKSQNLAKAEAEAKAKALEAEKAANEARMAANAPVEEEVAEEATAEDVPAVEAEATKEEE